MIDTPTENVKLTFEQLQQIDVFQKTLANINNEISINTKFLISERAECEKATKETIYQKELLGELETKVESIKIRLKDLGDNLNINRIELEEINKKSQTLGLVNQTRSEELDKKDKDLKINLEEYNKELEIFNVKFKELLEDQFSVNSAKEAFLKALETITWK